MKLVRTSALVVSLLALAACGKSQPDWLLTTEVSGNKVFLDASSVEQNGALRTFSVLTNTAEARKLSSGEVFQSAISKDEVDCETNRIRSLQVTFFEKPDGEGRAVFSKNEPNEWATIVMGSSAYKNKEHVCK